MYMRLGFSVAVHANPDILLIDEILAVGDEAFQQKCFEKIGEFRRRGKTIIFVSHDLAAVERWSDETVWLGEGIIRELGTPRRVIDLYRRALSAQGGKAGIAEHPWSEGAVRVES
jgi:ABC-type polysaccharide/polyol phosphate transport system ATPase subunit